ncbi:MAG: PmeII family type II restriction endonuclease [Hydrogenobacter sp.]
MKKEELLKKIENFVKDTISTFHEKRLEKLMSIRLLDIMKRKNPYLYKAKGLNTAYEIVKQIVDDFLTAHEETIFGNWLEDLAIFVCSKAFGGVKSSAQGIDLEFERDGKRYFVSVKSGPNWGNSGQIREMVMNFKKIWSRLPSAERHRSVFVEGCCYGRCGVQVKENFYYKYCGKDFWELISGIETLYVDIVEPIGRQAREKSEKYLEEYKNLLNRITGEFIRLFCEENGSVNWEKVLKYTSTKDYKV